MKYIWKLCLLVMICCTMPLSAQQKVHKGHPHKPLQTEMAQRQATRIANELAFSDEIRDRFIATFVNCQQEMWNLRKGHKSMKDNGVLSDEQVDSVIKARFDFSQRTLDLRRKYYDEYRKFLTPRQINRVYEQERAIMKHLGDKGGAPKHSQNALRKKSTKRQSGTSNN